MGIYINNTFAPAIKINQPIIPSDTMSVITGGITDVYSYASISVNIQDLLDARVTEGLNIQTFEDYYVSYVTTGAFAYQSVKNVNLPAVTTISNSAFISCYALENINIPNCTSIGLYAFQSCSNLSSIDLPACTSIGTYAFSGCKKLVSANLPVCISLSNVFRDCSLLNYVSLPNCTQLWDYAFYECRALSSIDLPQCSLFSGWQVFGGCSQLSYVSIPKCSVITSNCFQRCSSLQSISMPSCTILHSSAFYNCINLLSVYLNVSAIPSLFNINVFNSTPIFSSKDGVYGSIFVPTSLYSAFISATNWANYSSRIVSMNF